MKKVLKKFAKRQPEEQSSLRITNETVAEHRERVLAGGRRFKYPVQYARHKLVFNAIAISIIVLVAFGLISWWQLYKVQNSDTFFYRITKVLPLPVASIDGASVYFRDYLMRYRSQEHWLIEKGQIEQGSKSNQRQLDSIKRSVMDGVEADAFADKIAQEKGISVTSKEVDDVIAMSLHTANGTISQELYDASTLETLGYERDEYRLLIQQSLLRQKVAYALDTDAKNTVNALQQRIAKATAGEDITALAKSVSASAQVGSSGLVRKTNQDAGLTQAALKLELGKLSAIPVQSTTSDGYYFLRLDQLHENELSYSFIRVPLSTFDQMLAKVRKENKVKEYIYIPKVSTNQGGL